MRYYLPASHAFDHIAYVPWPTLSAQQQDWIQRVDYMESWLNSNLGAHWASWAWHTAQASSDCAVAFRWSRDQCLFLLKWHY